MLPTTLRVGGEHGFGRIKHPQRKEGKGKKRRIESEGGREKEREMKSWGRDSAVTPFQQVIFHFYDFNQVSLKL